MGFKSGEGFFIAVVFGAIFVEEFGLSVALVVRVGEAEVDEEGVFIFGGFAAVEVVEDLLAVPMGAGFIGVAAFGGVLDDLELVIRAGERVPRLQVRMVSYPARLKTAASECFFKIGRDECGVVSVGSRFLPGVIRREVPDAAPGHNHVTGAGADRAHPGAHVVGAIEDESRARESVDVGRF